jgi:hypothetical protein
MKMVQKNLNADLYDAWRRHFSEVPKQGWFATRAGKPIEVFDTRASYKVRMAKQKAKRT